MKSERVDRPNVIHVIDSLSVAFEGIFPLLTSWGRVEILHGDATFYRGGCISCIRFWKQVRGVGIGGE
jgi:hypothetical protein